MAQQLATRPTIPNHRIIGPRILDIPLFLNLPYYNSPGLGNSLTFR
ncbi:MAG TPA: hypothetical protein VFH68_18570 [Polyangia bacterium]|jgi:hypothetical protein|nr:hypothetical protein [Polyangia bacterium]